VLTNKNLRKKFMNKENNCELEEKSCGGRREFLVRATAVAGGLALTLSNLNNVSAKNVDDDKKSEEVFVKIDGTSGLSKVGGSETVKTDNGKVIVVRTADKEYKAFKAKCPHKGGPIKFDAAKQIFTCDWHESLFDKNGKVTNGPAKTDLTAFASETKTVLSIKVM
jgi:nitrite reductase/ring-hydroxylating ferredoxin subunit